MNGTGEEFVRMVVFLLLIAVSVAGMFFGGYYLVTEMMGRLPL